MTRALICALALVVLAAGPACADPPKLAVFDLELFDTSLEGEMRGVRPDEQERLKRSGDELRSALAASGRYQIVDIAPVKAAAQARNLQACGGCDVQLAQQIGADMDITGVVQKVSSLILNITLSLRNVRTGQLLATVNTDLRGNTDESWSRAVRFLVQNRLLAPNYGAPQ